MAHAFNTKGVVSPFGVFSNAAWIPQGRLLAISGQVAIDESGNVVGHNDVKAQTRFVLECIRTILHDAGGTLADVACVNVFLTRMTDLAACHEVRREFFTPPYPASTLVQVSALVKPELLVEINALASIPEK